MSDFIVRVLKWLAAIVTAYFLLFAFLFLVLIGIGIAFQPVAHKMEPNSILVLDLGFNLTDQPASDDPATLIRQALSGELRQTASLRQVLEALKQAQKDGDVEGLLIKGSLLADGSGGSFAALREVRQAIAAFAGDKPVWAYSEGDSLRDYYLKSAAKEVISDPYGGVDFRGLRAERLYFGDALERIGVDVQVEAFEEFKTASESFQRNSMSDEEREQLGELIGDLWESIVSDISASRGLDMAYFEAIASSELIVYGDEVLEMKFSDTQMSEDQLIEYLADRVGYDSSDKTFRQFDFLDYTFTADPLEGAFDLTGSGNKVAIIYIEGIMVDGEGEDGTIGSADLNRHLRELREDNSVKAIVLRVNTPGGSATAAGKVAREIELTNAEKPVVVSMGGIAASGGYMVAALGDTIFVEPTTITGSIGVVIMLPNVEQMAEKLSVNFDGVETHPFAGAFSIARPKTPEEMRQIRALAADFYDEFLMLVSVNRNMSLEAVRPLAKGRVWSGAAAVENGLADEIGGLMAAVQRAADLAGIGDDYRLIERPKALTLEEKIEELLIGSTSVRASSRSDLKSLVRDVEQELKRFAALNDPHGQYTLLPYTLKIR